MDEATMGIIEGFLCPICLKDLGEVSQLQAHFLNDHQSPDDRAVVDHLKGFLDRAKQRIMKFDPYLLKELSIGNEEMQQALMVSTAIQQPQEPGPSVSHMDDFRTVRNTTIDKIAVKTNNLIIRLDKLISEMPDDPTKRKAFEKSCVPWVDDAEVLYCRFCSGRFSLTRRRHHCRLCGMIMCHGCSEYLTFAYARKLTNPAFAASYVPEPIDRKMSKSGDSSGSPSGGATALLSSLRSPLQPAAIQARAERFISNISRISIKELASRDGSEVSLGSLLNQDGEEHLRVCPDCKDLLIKRDQQVETRTQPPIIVQIYERLMNLVNEVETIFPTYCKMAESLSTGESCYNLKTAQDLRLKIMKLHEQIDYVSKKIATHGQPSDESNIEPPISPKQALLQRNIRSFSSVFLQEMTMGMPCLPTEAEYKRLQAEYREELTRQIEQDRELSQSALPRNSQQPMSSAPVERNDHSRPVKLLNRPLKTTDEGWMADTKLTLNPFGSDDDETPIDPLAQQICIIKGYIGQAALSGRLEEVQTLEQNLKELQCELALQQQAITGRESESEAD